MPEKPKKNYSLISLAPMGLLSVATYLSIFYFGLKYAYYRIFVIWQPYDDDGSVLLLLHEYLKSPATYDLLGGYWGPFFYIYNYVLYTISGIDLSHDVIRMITIVLWGLIALISALFVHRVTRSLILAAIVQLQMLVHLDALIGSPGHPQGLALILIVGSLVLSCFVSYRRFGRLCVAAMGAAIGALMLVKINLGVYMGVSLALVMLLFTPGNIAKNYFLAVVAIFVLLMPISIMWSHVLSSPMDRNFCVMVTLTIAASLMISQNRNGKSELNFSDAAIASFTMIATMAVICGVVIAWGGSAKGIASAVLIRALDMSSKIHVPASVSEMAVKASVGSFLLALSYHIFEPRLRNTNARVLVLCILKVIYGCVTFYSMYRYTPQVVLAMAIPIPFLWIVLVEPNRDWRITENRIPRTYLCFLAALLTLVAYPVAGAQRAWACLLLIPLSVICICDALRALWPLVDQSFPAKITRFLRSPVRLYLLPLLLVPLCFWYYSEADFGQLAKRYSRYSPLELPGTNRLRLRGLRVFATRKLVDNVRENCDGFIGLPGFPSLYFWTEIESPGIIHGFWTVDLEEARQFEFIKIMEKYARPCVIHRPKAEAKWKRGAENYSEKPLVNYIHTNYEERYRIGDYVVMTRNR